MGVKAFVSFVWIAVLALMFGVHAQQSSTAPSPEWNNNTLISVQKHGGDPTRSGEVSIEFYGHDAFKITSPAGLTVLTDPWRNDSTGSFRPSGSTSFFRLTPISITMLSIGRADWWCSNVWSGILGLAISK